MQPKKKTSDLGCVTYCALLLFWPLLWGLVFAVISATRGAGVGVRSWLFGGGMDWGSYVLLGIALECLWLIQGLRGAKALLARRKREQEEQDRQMGPPPVQ